MQGVHEVVPRSAQKNVRENPGIFLYVLYFLRMNPVRKKKLAVFDVDGTLFRSSLLIELVDGLVKKGIFPLRAERVYQGQYEKWQNREGEYQHYIDAVVASFEQYIKGVSYKDLHAVSREICERYKNHVYRYTRDLVRELKAKEYFLLAVSQSPKVILEDFCKNLGFDKTYGRMYEIGPEGRFTGITADLHLIANKANIVRRVVEKENLTLHRSIGVGDSEGDIPFLEMVAKPVCFNPNSTLYRYARLMRWSMVVERKDVIYRL